MWTLGNAGMGALQVICFHKVLTFSDLDKQPLIYFHVCFQRLAGDSNPAIAAAASKTILALKKQWQIEEGDSWRFVMDQSTLRDSDNKEDDDR